MYLSSSSCVGYVRERITAQAGPADPPIPEGAWFPFSCRGAGEAQPTGHTHTDTQTHTDTLSLTHTQTQSDILTQALTLLTNTQSLTHKHTDTIRHSHTGSHTLNEHTDKQSHSLTHLPCTDSLETYLTLNLTLKHVFTLNCCFHHRDLLFVPIKRTSPHNVNSFRSPQYSVIPHTHTHTHTQTGDQALSHLRRSHGAHMRKNVI